MPEDTPFVESNAVLAAVREDWAEARRHLRQMTVHELRNFAHTLDELAECALQVKERKIDDTL